MLLPKVKSQLVFWQASNATTDICFVYGEHQSALVGVLPLLLYCAMQRVSLSGIFRRTRRTMLGEDSSTPHCKPSSPRFYRLERGEEMAMAP